MRNQYMAKVLVHNKVVTEAQVKAHWNEITDKNTMLYLSFFYHGGHKYGN